MIDAIKISEMVRLLRWMVHDPNVPEVYRRQIENILNQNNQIGPSEFKGVVDQTPAMKYRI